MKRFQLLLFLSISFSMGSHLFAGGEDLLRQAFLAYKEAEKSQMIAQRRELFLSSLQLYKAVEAFNSHPSLSYNIANCYFQLEEYPWAILYYEKALKLQPRSKLLKKHLEIALAHAGIDRKASTPSLAQLLFLSHWLSENEKYFVFALFSSLGFVCASAAIWKSGKQLNKIAVFSCISAACFLLTALIPHYFLSSEGILIQSTMIRCDAGSHYDKVDEKPLLAGDKIFIINHLENEDWVEIATVQGVKGFIAQDAVRAISH